MNLEMESCDGDKEEQRKTKGVVLRVYRFVELVGARFEELPSIVSRCYLPAYDRSVSLRPAR